MGRELFLRFLIGVVRMMQILHLVIQNKGDKQSCETAEMWMSGEQDWIFIIKDWKNTFLNGPEETLCLPLPPPPHTHKHAPNAVQTLIGDLLAGSVRFSPFVLSLLNGSGWHQLLLSLLGQD